MNRERNPPIISLQTILKRQFSGGL
jgi:hypothetical protein